jgi:hypothetical protein
LFGQPKISLEDLETRLNAAFATRYRPFAGALVSYAYTPSAADGANLVSCRWCASPSTSKGAKEVIRRLELAA